MQGEVILVIICKNPLKPTQVKVLLSANTFPRGWLNENKSSELAEKLLFNYTGLKPGFGWIKLRLLGLMEEINNPFQIIYGCVIPEEVKLKHSNWADIHNINSILGSEDVKILAFAADKF